MFLEVKILHSSLAPYWVSRGFHWTESKFNDFQ
jgi:hypothetical protein